MNRRDILRRACSPQFVQESFIISFMIWSSVRIWHTFLSKMNICNAIVIILFKVQNSTLILFGILNSVHCNKRQQKKCISANVVWAAHIQIVSSFAIVNIFAFTCISAANQFRVLDKAEWVRNWQWTCLAVESEWTRGRRNICTNGSNISRNQ